jgi:hypothetical protein
MAKTPATTKTNVPAAQGSANVPDYLRPHLGQGSGLQGLDVTDFVVPRVKLLQAISPEVEAFEDAKPGMFWLTVLDKPLSQPGENLDFIPISNRKKYLLLAPLGDGRNVLARAEDGIHWTPPDREWQVKLKGVKNPVTWATNPTVRESGLAEFGTMNPDDPDSNPAAVLFYEYLVLLPGHPDLGPVLLSLARSQAKRARDLNGKIDMRQAPMQAQLFRMSVTDETGEEGPYKNVAFANNGWATEAQFEKCKALAERYKSYRAADEEAQGREGQGAEAPPPAGSTEY